MLQPGRHEKNWPLFTLPRVFLKLKKDFLNQSYNLLTWIPRPQYMLCTLNMPIYIHSINNYFWVPMCTGTFGVEVISINKIDEILHSLESSWQETITKRKVFLHKEVKANMRNKVGWENRKWQARVEIF